MARSPEFVAEQEIVIWRSASDQKRVTIRISEPRLEKDRDGRDSWACYPKLDGLVAIDKPVREISSFRALVVALLVCRQLIRDEAKGAKLFMVDSLHGSGLFPDDGMSLKELFESQ
jgi:hypothetical protein